MKTKRLLCWLLIILILCPAVGVAQKEEKAVLTLPQELTVIDKEVFSGIGDVEKVVLRENIRRIESRAFAESEIREIYIPDSVEYIADDAFEDCKNVIVSVQKNSYAHRWAAFSDVEYVVIDDEDEPELEERYRLSGIELKREGSDLFAAAYVTTAEACILRIRFLDETDESVQMVFDANVPAGLQDEYTKVPIDQTLPDYFLLEAVLLDAKNKALCSPVCNISYSEAYFNSETARPSDYPTDRVIDLGETGYLVLAQGVVNVADEAHVSGDHYTLPASAFGGRIPSAGDVLMLNVGGSPTPVKVGAVSSGAGNTLTIEAEGDLYLCDVFDKVNINGYVETDGNGVGAGAGVRIPLDETYTSKDKMLTVHATGGVSVYVKATYDKKRLGRDYFFFDTEANVEIDVVGTIHGECETEEDEIKLTLYDGIIILPGINIPANLDVILPVNAGVEGKGVLTFHYEKVAGFTWDTKNGFKEKEDPHNNYADVDLQVDFWADAGPKVILDISLWEFFGAKVDGQIGLMANGTLFGKLHAGYEEPADAEEIHACDSCLSVDIDLFAKANATIYYRITEELSDDLFDEQIFFDSCDLMELYASLINEKESIFGGQYAAGLGTCPNYKYLVNVSTQDMYGKAVNGLTVNISGSNGSTEALVSPGAVHLYDANYTAEASFSSGLSTERFSVSGAPEDVVVKEMELTIEGTVTDDQTGQAIGGALVELTLPDGSIRTASTDAEGKYLFDKLLRGTYALSFSKEDYETKKISRLDYSAADRVQFNISLVPRGCPVITAKSRAVNNRVQALTADGTCPEGVPEVYITVKTGGSAYIQEVVINHENCADDFVYEANWYTVSMDFFGVDMGDGEYTYVMQLASSGTGGGADVIVLRENDGKLEVISGLTENIKVQASFSDDTHFSGIILPANVRISGEMPLPYSGFKRAGESIWGTGGHMTYEMNENGSYDLIFRERNIAGGYNWDDIGSSVTRYVMKDGSLLLHSQTFDVYEGGTVTVY